MRIAGMIMQKILFLDSLKGQLSWLAVSLPTLQSHSDISLPGSKSACFMGCPLPVQQTIMDPKRNRSFCQPPCTKRGLPGNSNLRFTCFSPETTPKFIYFQF